MRVALFVTCLVDLFRPSVGFATVKLLERAGCTVEVPEVQTCCGQPAYNNGDEDTAREIAKQVIVAFADYPHVVVPSGSCGGMLKRHYPRLLEDDPEWGPKARALAERTHELTAFLADVLGVTELGARFRGTVTYHDSCSSLREMGVHEQPRRLLQQVAGLQVAELEGSEVCCGFGGTFCVKYPEISERMVSDKAKAARATGAQTLLAADLGCLLNIAGRLRREGGEPLRVFHIAELLAGETDRPAIGEGEG